MKTQWLYFGIIILLLTVSCKKKELEPVDLKKDYFQLTQGSFIEYDVTYIFHDEDLLKHDTILYQLRTQIGDTVIDNAGRVARKFNRYIRETSSDNWVLKDVWTAIIVDSRAELVEENQRKVKMVFAPTEDKTWNINEFNMDTEVIVSYDSIDVARSFLNLTFDKTLIVREKKYTTLIDKQEKHEIYARGVGMIYKVEKDLKFNFGETIPNKGTESYHQIFRYGIE